MNPAPPGVPPSWEQCPDLSRLSRRLGTTWTHVRLPAGGSLSDEDEQDAGADRTLHQATGVPLANSAESALGDILAASGSLTAWSRSVTGISVGLRAGTAYCGLLVVMAGGRCRTEQGDMRPSIHAVGAMIGRTESAVWSISRMA